MKIRKFYSRQFTGLTKSAFFSQLLIFILMCLWGVISVNAAFEETNSMHWWTDAAGSNMDANGNIWNVYASHGNPDPQLDTTEWDTWTLLNYDGANTQWGSRPGFNSSKIFMANGYYYAPGLIFEASKMGSYSWQGTVSVPTFNAATLVFGKIVNGQWSSLGSNLVIPLYGTCDLSTIGELQNVLLGIGDKLTVYIMSDGGWVDCSFTNASIGFNSNTVPFWTGVNGSTEGNPYTDGIGNQWGVYNSKGNPNPQFDTTAWDKWTLLAYDSTNILWGSRPGFNSNKVFMANGYYYAPGLTFEAAQIGRYSWRGSVSVLTFNAATFTFGKIVNGVWSALGSDIVVPLYGTLDLSTVSELQDIPLETGDKLTVYIRKPGGGWTDVSMENAGISAQMSFSPGSTTYYVDSLTGNDQNDGLSSSTPWASLAAVNSMCFSPGDKILFKTGTQYTGCLSPNGSGTAALPIVIDQYGVGAKPQIHGQGDVCAVVYLYNVEYWEVSNLEITNQGSIRKDWIYGVLIHADNFGTAHDIKIKDLYVHDIYSSIDRIHAGGGIFWKANGEIVSSRFDGLLIEGCHLVRTDLSGIRGVSAYCNRDEWYPSLNVVIRRNLLEDIGGDGIVTVGTDGCLIEYNIINEANTRSVDCAVGIWPWGSDNTVIQFNEVSGMKGTKDSQAFDSDYNCQNSLFQYNYSHDNEGGFFLLINDAGSTLPGNIGNTGTVIRYNVSQNDGGGQYEAIFDFCGNPTNVQIYNNTIYISSSFNGPVVNTWFLNNPTIKPSNIQFSNNIFYVAGYGYWVFGGGDYNFSNNVYYGNLSVPSDPYAITANPNFIAVNSGSDGITSLTGYGLTSSSPCISSGKNIANNGGIDFLGASILSPPSIGAFQYGTPVVETVDISLITSTTAQSGGQVVNQGAASVSARGVCWGTSPMPTLADSYTQNGSGTGNYSSSMTGLSPSTAYYVRAYATNSSGTRYGHQLGFTTLP